MTHNQDRSIRVASIQMEGSPASKTQRLERAATLIAEATEGGANLVVLPAFFNTGVTYLETNYENTEQIHDKTVEWLRTQAQQHQVYLAGSLLLLEHDDAYHAAFLAAPDGQIWRYDQQYPLLWERAFYRGGHGLTVADTPLGKIGLLIGWDAAHSELWERYAAKVDLMLVLSAQQAWDHAQVNFPDHTEQAIASGNFLVQEIAKRTSHDLPEIISEQGEWLGVPVVCSGMSGTFSSILPAPQFSVGALCIGSYDGDFSQYPDACLTAPFMGMTQILGADGTLVQGAPEQEEAFILADLPIPEKTPFPQQAQPTISLPQALYWLLDVFIAGLLGMTYQRGLRRQWGARMAPDDVRTRQWLQITVAAAFVGWVVGFLVRGKQKNKR